MKQPTEKKRLFRVILITFFASVLFMAIMTVFLVKFYNIDIVVRSSADIVDKEVFYPEKCTLPSGFDCMDFSGNENGVTLIIQNNAGFDAHDLDVKVKFPTADMDCTDSAGDSILIADEIDTFTCSGALYYGQHKGTVTMDYVNVDSGLSHSKSGDIIVQVTE
ncbi:MAG: hypothetical protein ABIA62_01440 [Candidatus Woesearchaeota archaeon]